MYLNILCALSQVMLDGKTGDYIVVAGLSENFLAQNLHTATSTSDVGSAIMSTLFFKFR